MLPLNYRYPSFFFKNPVTWHLIAFNNNSIKLSGITTGDQNARFSGRLIYTYPHFSKLLILIPPPWWQNFFNLPNFCNPCNTLYWSPCWSLPVAFQELQLPSLPLVLFIDVIWLLGKTGLLTVPFVSGRRSRGHMPPLVQRIPFILWFGMFAKLSMLNSNIYSFNLVKALIICFKSVFFLTVQ